MVDITTGEKALDQKPHQGAILFSYLRITNALHATKWLSKELRLIQTSFVITSKPCKLVSLGN